MNYQMKSRILSNKRLGREHYLMRFEAGPIAKTAKPGQFIHLRCSDKVNPLLRRPFSIHKTAGKTLYILYQLVGRGTEILAKKKTGEYLDIIGPLGNGFSYSRAKSANSILVAGGIGIAPILMLARKLIQYQKGAGILLLVGAKTKRLILCERDFKTLGIGVKISTDDGSYGWRGMVTELLEDRLSANRCSSPAIIYACGPEKMLKKVAEISRRHDMKAQGSLEKNMACGVGACLGCVVTTRSGYQRVCKEGPVFDLDEIIWGQ